MDKVHFDVRRNAGQRVFAWTVEMKLNKIVLFTSDGHKVLTADRVALDGVTVIHELDPCRTIVKVNLGSRVGKDQVVEVNR